MTVLTTLLLAAVAVYVGKKLLSGKHSSDLQPIRIKTDEPRTKYRR